MEGYATGASVHEATGAMVLVAVDAGNLSAVVESMDLAKYPKIVIAADNDHGKEKNTGIDSAKAIIAKNPHVEYIAPPEMEGRAATDWNDWISANGKEKAAPLLMSKPRILTYTDLEKTDNLTLDIDQT